jgi:hypothetical protein
LIYASDLADQTWVLTLWTIFQTILGWLENEEAGDPAAFIDHGCLEVGDCVYKQNESDYEEE